MYFNEPVNQNCAHLRVDVVLLAHIISVNESIFHSSKAVLINFSCVLAYILRVKEDGLIYMIYLALKEISLFKFCVEVCNLLLVGKLLALETKVMLECANSRRFFHAAIVSSAF